MEMLEKIKSLQGAAALVRSASTIRVSATARLCHEKRVIAQIQYRWLRYNAGLPMWLWVAPVSANQIFVRLGGEAHFWKWLCLHILP